MKKNYFLMMLIVILLFSTGYANAGSDEAKKLATNTLSASRADLLTKKRVERAPERSIRSGIPSDVTTTMKSSTGKTIYGYVINNNDGSSGGISSFNTAALNDVRLLHAHPKKYLASGGAVVDGYLYCFVYDVDGFLKAISFSKINMNTGHEEIIVNYEDIFTGTYNDMTYDYTTNTMYYITEPEDTFGTALGKINLTNGETSNVKTISEEMSFMTLACDNNGQLFGIADDGNLYNINKTTGEIKSIGFTGSDEYSGFQSMDFDHDTNELYYASCNYSDESFLLKVNTETGETDNLGTIGADSRITCLYVPFTPIPDGAPSVATDVVITAGANGTKTAKIDFKAPKLTVGGSNLPSITKIDIFRDETTLIKTFTAPTTGSALTYTDNVTASKEYSYKIVATNSVADGVPVRGNSFIGEDVAAAPTNVVLTSNEMTATINWTAATTGLNGGWCDPSSLGYEITRFPDNVIIATNLKTTTYIDNSIKQMGYYSYKVQSKTKAGDGGIAISNAMTIGSVLQLPYNCKFDNKADFKIWSVIDTNNDDATWEWSNEEKAAMYMYHDDNNGDDWLISAPIYMEAGKIYRLTFDIQTYDCSEKMKVYYGEGATIDAQKKNLLADYEDIPEDYNATKTLEIAPTKNGNYNISFHECSENNAYALFIRNLTVKENFDNDLMTLSIVGNTRPMVDKSYLYTINVKNDGRILQNSYKVQIVNNAGEVLSSTDVSKAIEAGESKDVEIIWIPKTVGSTEIKGRVVLIEDQVSYNNETEAIKVDIMPTGDSEWAMVGFESELDSSMPIDLWFYSSASQTIYNKKDINMNGMIKKIIYSYSNTTNKEIGKPLQIYMSMTELTNLSGGAIPKDGMTLVFDGEIVMAAGDGELELELTSPFLYSSENLCITALSPINESSFTNVFFKTTKTGEAEVTGTYSDDREEWNWEKFNTTETAMPNIKLFAITAGGGKITGVIKSGETVIEGAKVTITSLGLTAITDAKGIYTFGYVPMGTHVMSVTRHGFLNTEVDEVITLADETTIVDISMTELAKQTISGTVKDINGNNVAEANVAITGYDNYKTRTNANGEFTIANVYKANDYSVKVVKKGLSASTTKFNVEDNDITLTIILNDAPHVPKNVIATTTTSKADITWMEPAITIFRHDDGIAAEQLGILEGNEKGILGSVHRNAAIINNMSWYTNPNGGPHETVNIFVMDLNSITGEPTSKVLFSKMDVPNKDSQWTTFNFEEPIECPNGFMIAISYKGFVALACDSGLSEEYPAVDGGNYFSFDYTEGEYSKQRGCNFLIRAEGYETAKTAVAKSESKSMQGYSIWRLNENDIKDETKWEKLTPNAITTLSYSDNSWQSVQMGTYKYAIKAHYSEDVISAPAFSNMVAKDMLAEVTINVKTNTPTVESKGAAVTLTNIDGNNTHIYNAIVDKEGKALIKDVWKGIYTVDITLEGFTPVTVSKVDMQATSSSHSYTIIEIVTAPFNLTISKTDDEFERILTWNTSTIIEDDFETHDDFTLNSIGTVGWDYIDADKKSTSTFNKVGFPNALEPTAYIIFNPSTTEPPIGNRIGIEPHSGNKYQAAFASYKAKNEDYIISPKLSFATNFTLSFWAKSYIDKYGLERMKVGYSTTGKTEADFTNWLTDGEYEETPNSWTKYTYNLPANVKYITIVCISDDAFVFMLDDITIEQVESKALTQYEVYLDNVKVEETTDVTHTFKELTKGKHTAGVKAIHTSTSTSISTVEFEVGLDAVNTVSSTNLHIYPNPVRDILNIEGEYQSLMMYNIAGEIVMTANGQQTVDVKALKTGVYIIKAYNNEQVGIYKIVK